MLMLKGKYTVAALWLNLIEITSLQTRQPSGRHKYDCNVLKTNAYRQRWKVSQIAVSAYHPVMIHKKTFNSKQLQAHHIRRRRWTAFSGNFFLDMNKLDKFSAMSPDVIPLRMRRSTFTLDEMYMSLFYCCANGICVTCVHDLTYHVTIDIFYVYLWMFSFKKDLQENLMNWPPKFSRKCQQTLTLRIDQWKSSLKWK